MPDPDYKALCAELIDATLSDDSHIDCVQIARQARAALAQPEPVAPTDEELITMWATTSYIDQPEGGLALARAVLARWGTPAVEPVPVSERLPGPENKTTDDECWFWDPISGCWFLLPGPPLNDYYTHWLPHHSLPIPRSGTH
jgi:hypothetical protein